MTIEKHRLHAGKKGITTIDVTPARLDHEQPGLFRTEAALVEASSFEQGNGCDSVRGGSTMWASRLNVEQSGRSGTSNRCFID